MIMYVIYAGLVYFFLLFAFHKYVCTLLLWHFVLEDENYSRDATGFDCTIEPPGINSD